MVLLQATHPTPPLQALLTTSLWTSLRASLTTPSRASLAPAGRGDNRAGGHGSSGTGGTRGTRGGTPPITDSCEGPKPPRTHPVARYDITLGDPWGYGHPAEDPDTTTSRYLGVAGRGGGQPYGSYAPRVGWSPGPFHYGNFSPEQFVTTPGVEDTGEEFLQRWPEALARQRGTGWGLWYQEMRHHRDPRDRGSTHPGYGFSPDRIYG